MKNLLISIMCAISIGAFSQNPSYNIIYDSINPLLAQKKYEEAKKIWKELENIDPHNQYFFAFDALKFGDEQMFKKLIKNLIKNHGYKFTFQDTLYENRQALLKNAYEKGHLDWMIEYSNKYYPKWMQKNPEAVYILRQIDLIYNKDIYLREILGEHIFNDSNCIGQSTASKYDFLNAAKITKICIDNNGIPNSFEHGQGAYKIMLIILHNMKNNTNRQNVWNMMLLWIDKAYFEGKIHSSYYQTYDYLLFNATGYQYYGFIKDAPVKDPEAFKKRMEKYKFQHNH